MTSKQSKSEEKKKPDTDEKLESEIAEVGQTLSKISEKEPQIVSEFMAMAGMGIPRNPIHNKLTEKHLDKIVDLAIAHDERQYSLHKTSQDNTHKDSQHERYFNLAYFVIALAVFLIILFELKDTPDILIPTLTGLGGLVSGFLAGLGFSNRNKK